MSGALSTALAWAALAGWPASLLASPPAVVAAAVDPAAEVVQDPDVPPDAASESTPTPAPDDAEVTVSPELVGPETIDTILPCGLRVIIAEDGTLPVAATILSVETGSEDDPAELPGLTHALAYQLLQGNRDYGPGGISTMAADAGGLTLLATGPAQTRFEALVPVSLLAEMLRAESQRLRAPTVDEHLWSDALTWARRDAARTWSVPREAMAAAHGAPGLAHDGRKVNPALVALTPRQVSSFLADRFGYDRATLVVVAPEPPLAVLARIQPLFATLPKRPRSVVRRDPVEPPPSDRMVEVDTADGRVMTWAVPAGPAALGWARAMCRALNRQRRDEAEPRRARVRCTLDRDPRRAVLVVRALGTDDPRGLITARLARLRGDEDRGLLERQRAAVVRDVERDLGTALPLARALAAAVPRRPDDDAVTRGLHLLTGLASLRSGSDPRVEREATAFADPQRGVLLIPPRDAP